jgi:heme exporter protein C
MWRWFYRLGSPPFFYRLAGKLWPVLAGLGGLAMLAGVGAGLFFAPLDYQQGDAYRMIFVHVPAAALSLSIYMALAVAGVIALVWRMKVAEVALVAAAPVGAGMTALALVTGMLWGKPMWGTYWAWDPRLTAELVLLFFYLGIIALAGAFNDARQGARAAAWLAVVGVVNVPIVKYSVTWWNSLHQGSTLLSIKTMQNPTMSQDMLWPLLLSLLGFYLCFASVWLLKIQSGLLQRERRSQWVLKVKEEVKDGHVR